MMRLKTMVSKHDVMSVSREWETLQNCPSRCPVELRDNERMRFSLLCLSTNSGSHLPIHECGSLIDFGLPCLQSEIRMDTSIPSRNGLQLPTHTTL